jgi:hypothetical protein
MRAHARALLRTFANIRREWDNTSLLRGGENRRYPFERRGVTMATIAEQPQHKRWSMARIIIASSAGTAFEWYDFFIFGSLAPVISKVFFSGLDPTPALIAALALFAAGFAFRPLGALIFGVVGDRLGRKGAFLITVSLMGTATFLIGFLPTYAQAGTTGPTLLIILRVLQGIALGGEYGGAAIYVAEHSPANKRGASTGWIQASASFGLLAALLVIVATRTSIGEERGKQAERGRRLDPTGGSTALVRGRMLGHVNRRAAIFAAERDTLEHAQNDQQRRPGCPRLRISRQEADEERRGSHERNGDEERALAAEPVPDNAEDQGAERTEGEAGSE